MSIVILCGWLKRILLRPNLSFLPIHFPALVCKFLKGLFRAKYEYLMIEVAGIGVHVAQITSIRALEPPGKLSRHLIGPALLAVDGKGQPSISVNISVLIAYDIPHKFIVPYLNFSK